MRATSLGTGAVPISKKTVVIHFGSPMGATYIVEEETDE